jgi:hypothetical protein
LIESGIDEIGAVVTGGLAARALEPEAGTGQPHAGNSCLNCGAVVTSNYCGECGQQAHVHRTLGAFWHDIAHSVLHFEGKIWRTLPMLAWRPGELTRRYVQGERARFVSPMALFLFSVFLMFAVISAFGGPFGGGTPAEERAETVREYRAERAENEAELKELTAEYNEAKATGKATASIQAQIDAVRLEMKLEEEEYRRDIQLANAEEARERQAPKGKGDEGEYRSDFRLIGETGWTTFDKAVEKASKNRSLLFYKLQTNAYKFSWALIPISVPFVWLLFLHRRRYRQYRAYDHVVFVTYSIAFMSLGYIALTLLRPLGASSTIAGLAIAFGPPIHMYRQLRGAYQLSRFSALWRTFLLINFAFIAAGLFFMLLVALGVLG